MGTPFTEIYDRFLVMTNDYKIDDKFKAGDDEIALKYLEGMLMSAMPLFQEYLYDKTLGEFIDILSVTEQNILANCMVEVWFFKEINNATAMASLLQGRDKKNESQATFLDKKRAYLSTLVERRDQLVETYQIEKIKKTLEV